MPLHYVIRADDRASFLRCRRAWDLGARERRNLEPTHPTDVADLERALLDALAVYYFPGMWDWSPAIVLPLVRKAFHDSISDQRAAYLKAHEIDVLPPEREQELAACSDQGLRMLEAYFGWAPTVDDLSPVSVVVEIDTTVPDHRAPQRDVVSPDGRPVRLRDRIHVLAIDEHNNYWMMEHRLVRGPWPELDAVRLDDRCMSWSWVWQREYGGMRIEGTIYNELRLGTPPVAAPPPGPRGSVSQTDTYIRPWASPVPADEPVPAVPRPEYESRVRATEDFRRILVPRTRAEIAGFGTVVSAQVIDMIDASTACYPNPSPLHCGACSFRAPCIAMNTDGDAEAILRESYGQRGEEARPGRLGGTTSAMNRGGGALSQLGRRRPP